MSDDLLTELNTIKDGLTTAAVLAQDPIAADQLTGMLTTVEGMIDQLTPRAAETMVAFPQEPAVQQAAAVAPSQTEPIGTPAAPAANADVGGAEDEPA